MSKNGYTNAQNIWVRIGGASMKLSVEEFRDLLISRGVDASSIALYNWEVQVTLQGITYAVWPTTGKWRRNKDNVVNKGLEDFMAIVDEGYLKTVYEIKNPPSMGKKTRTGTWIEPFELAQHSGEIEQRSIMNCIGDLLKEVPRGGNIQLTVSPVECSSIDAIGRTMKVTVQAQYFDKMEG